MIMRLNMYGMNIKEFLMINLKENIGFLNKVIDQIVRETKIEHEKVSLNMIDG
jgi:hypothetical protein